jgi:hemolysin III
LSGQSKALFDPGTFVVSSMSLFRREANGRIPRASQAVRGEIRWDYDRAELIADGIVHAAGVLFGLTGVLAIVAIALGRKGQGATPVLIYGVGLLAMLGISALYNMWPVSRLKWLLRRFDHSAIYLLIAGTYTPFLAQMKSGLLAVGLGIGMWASAAFGIALKLLLPGRFDAVSIGLYLALGWIGVVAYDSFTAAIPPASVHLLWLGGALYSVGIVFHAWERLRFQNAIWHGFVLVAAMCHYVAVLRLLLV